MAEHGRAPDGAHRRALEPAHYAALFRRKPRAQVMRYRQTLLELGAVAARYVAELSHRQRNWPRQEVLAAAALHQQAGTRALLAAMARAEQQGAYGAAYLQALLAPGRGPHRGGARPAGGAPGGREGPGRDRPGAGQL